VESLDSAAGPCNCLAILRTSMILFVNPAFFRTVLADVCFPANISDLVKSPMYNIFARDERYSANSRQ